MTDQKMIVRTRRQMVELRKQGVPVAEIAQRLGFSQKTVYKWLRRFATEGEAGLCNRSSRPHKIDRTPVVVEEKIRTIRRLHGYSPLKIHLLLRRHYNMQVSVGAIWNVLKRHNENRVRTEKKPVVRYEKDRPWELVHIDVKHLKSIKGYGKQYQFTAVDDCTRRTFARRYPRKTAKNAVDFLGRAHAWSGEAIEKVLVDNGLEFTHHTTSGKRKHKFHRACERLGIKLRFTRKRRPQTNGKVERVHRTVDEEFYTRNFFTTPDDLDTALEMYLRYYNGERIHLGIKGLTPDEKYAQIQAQKMKHKQHAKEVRPASKVA